MARVLVVGGTGHTGERVVRRLMRHGHRTLVLTRRTDSAVARSLEAAGAVLREGDCTRRWTLFDALEGCEALVCCSHPRYAQACIQACDALDVPRMILLSSARRFTRYPDTAAREVIEGESALAVSKLSWTIVRATMIYGGQRDNNLTRLVNWFRKRSWAPIFGNDRALVQPVFVEDVVHSIVAALEIEESVGIAFNVAGPQPLTQRRFLTEIAEACGRRNPILIPVPVAPAIAALSLVPSFLLRDRLTPDMIRRTQENKDVDIAETRRVLRLHPTTFANGIRLKVEGKAEVEALYPN